MISILNRITSIPTNGQILSGAYENLDNKYDSFSISISSDQTGQLTVFQSNDAGSTDHYEDTYNITSFPYFTYFKRKANYIKVTWLNNSGSDNTSFYLQLKYHEETIGTDEVTVSNTVQVQSNNENLATKGRQSDIFNELVGIKENTDHLTKGKEEILTGGGLQTVLYGRDPDGQAIVIKAQNNALNTRVTNTVSVSNNRIPHSLRYYRSRGECFIHNAHGYINATSADSGFNKNVWSMYNDDNDNCYLYNLTLMVNHVGTGTGGAVTIELLRTSSKPTGGQSALGQNLKIGEGLDFGMSNRVGVPPPTNSWITSAGGGVTMESWKIKLDADQRNDIVIIDFQEEMIEIPNGQGLMIKIIANNENTSINYVVTGRYVYTSLTSEF